MWRACDVAFACARPRLRSSALREAGCRVFGSATRGTLSTSLGSRSKCVLLSHPRPVRNSPALTPASSCTGNVPGLEAEAHVQASPSPQASSSHPCAMRVRRRTGCPPLAVPVAAVASRRPDLTLGTIVGPAQVPATPGEARAADAAHGCAVRVPGPRQAVASAYPGVGAAHVGSVPLPTEEGGGTSSSGACRHTLARLDARGGGQ